MTDDHPHRPDERHSDFQDLSSKLSEMVAAYTVVKRASVFLVGAIIVAIIPLMIAGVGAVTSSVQKQEVMVDQFGEFKEDFNQFQSEQKTYNERTSEMWYRGGYGSRKEAVK